MPETPDIPAKKKFYRDEITDKEFYRRLARKTEDEDFRNSLLRLSNIESEHSKFWKEELERLGVNVAKIRHNRLKVALLMFVRRIIGPYLTVRLLEHGEINTVESYSAYANSLGSESKFREGLERIIHEEIEHEEIFENRMEKTESNIERNRDIIYGISDGLVEVLAAIAGLTAIIVNNLDIALGGMVVGLGGAISMSLGAYLAKNSETEYRISELRKTSLFNRKKKSDKEISDYEGKSKKSALNVGGFYVLGALIPILPYVFLERHLALITSIILVGLSQGFSNAIVALSMNIKILKMSVRAALLSLLAAAATFSVSEFFHLFFHITLV